MRLLALLLSFYIACLSCLPCTDEVQVCVEQAPMSFSAAPHSDCGRNALGDWCSPLCQCQCCAGAVVAPFTEAVLVVAPLIQEWVAGPRHAPLVVAAPTHRAGAVWQPPQA
jgi:hypothetical protein